MSGIDEDGGGHAVIEVDSFSAIQWWVRVNLSILEEWQIGWKRFIIFQLSCGVVSVMF